MDDLIKSWLKFSSNVLVKTENMYFFRQFIFWKIHSFHTFTVNCHYHDRHLKKLFDYTWRSKAVENGKRFMFISIKCVIDFSKIFQYWNVELPYFFVSMACNGCVWKQFLPERYIFVLVPTRQHVLVRTIKIGSLLCHKIRFYFIIFFIEQC